MALDWSEPDPERQAAMLLHGEVGLGQGEEGRFVEWAINWFSWSLRLHCHFQHGLQHASQVDLEAGLQRD